MLDLKAKLLAAGLVTADQVKKVEDEEANKKARAAERREAERRRREEGPPPREQHRDRRGPRPERRPDRRPERDEKKGPIIEKISAKPRDTRSFKERRADEALEKRARREHEWTESLRWRTRLDELQAAGKSEQYAAIRGWVMKERLDNKQITDAAEKFFFTSYEGTLAHLTVEPDIQRQLAEGEAGIVAFIGYNGAEHAVVAKDIAKDIKTIKVEWLRHLQGVTDVEPPPVRPPREENSEESAVEGEAEPVMETDAPDNDDNDDSDDIVDDVDSQAQASGEDLAEGDGLVGGAQGDDVVESGDQ